MKYKFVIEISSGLTAETFDSPQDRFQSAVDCSKGAIESILHDYAVKINSVSNVITIEFDQSNAVDEKQLKEMVKPAFCDRSGNMFPEFKVVNVEKI